MSSPATSLSVGDTPKGFVFALLAYLMWGFMPLYLKLVQHVPVVEVLAHRVIWSVPLALLVLLIMGRTADLRAALSSPRTLAMGAVTATLISVNWGIYVWAIMADRALEAALGYYINPLFSILLGALLLGEKLTIRQWSAVALAAAAVAVLTIETGVVPVVSLALTVSWGCYALFKRTLPIGPNQGFTLEVLLLTPPALAYMVWAAGRGDLFMASAGGLDMALLFGCGVITAVPLMIYANGAKLLRLSTIAIMQYIAPTMVFLIAVFVFAEPFGRAQMIAFPMIWAALLLYSSEILRRRR